MRRESDIGTYDTVGPYSGPATERPRDKDGYQDGDRGLSDRWRDMPYADTEPPHPDADPRKDAPPAGRRRKRLRFDDMAVAAAMAISAQDDEAEQREQEELAALRWDDARYGSDSWRMVAPYVDAVLNLMQGCENFGDMDSRLDQSGAPDAEMVTVIARVAQKHFGFGYREAPKQWESFQELVPAVAGLLKDSNSRFKLEKSLQKVADSIKRKVPFTGLADQSEANFKAMEFDVQMEDGEPTDPLQVYEEGVPARVPELESRNVKRIIALHDGDPALAGDIADGLGRWRIIDFGTGKFHKDRLQSVARYIVDRPTAPEAPWLVVALLVREAVKQGAREPDVLFDEAGGHEGGAVRLNVTPDQVLQGLPGASRSLVDTWLSIAASTLLLVGKLPAGEKGEDDTAQDRARARMAANAAKIAIAVAEKMLTAMLSASRRNIREEFQAVQKIQDEYSKIVESGGSGDSEYDAMVERMANESRPAMDGMLDAVRRNDMAGLGELAVRFLRVVEGFVRDNSKTRRLRESVESLRETLSARPARAASTAPVADIAKRILAPAKSRVVTREDAEEGIDVGDDKELKLPSRYHAVSQALGVR